jgi:hypothetical protein
MNLVISSENNGHPDKEEKPLGSVRILSVKDISGKFKFIGNCYNIRTIFKTNHALRSSLMRTSSKEIHSG